MPPKECLTMTASTWTQEESVLSTPYSEKEAWERILMEQLVLGTSRFQGPPGLLEEMERLLASSTVQEMTSRLLTGEPLRGRTMAG
jgi:hypothetical protein